VTAPRSNYHVELNPSDVGSQDRYVVQEVIKELAKNRPLDVAGAQHSTAQHVALTAAHVALMPSIFFGFWVPAGPVHVA
jgi:hypothetical protein